MRTDLGACIVHLTPCSGRNHCGPSPTRKNAAQNTRSPRSIGAEQRPLLQELGVWGPEIEIEYAHTYIHACMHTYLPTYLPTYLFTYLPTNLNTGMHTYIHTYTYICIYVYTPKGSNVVPF